MLGEAGKQQREEVTGRENKLLLIIWEHNMYFIVAKVFLAEVRNWKVIVKCEITRSCEAFWPVLLQYGVKMFNICANMTKI